MTCDHPDQCRNEYGECQWCEEINRLNWQVEGLLRVVRQNAIVVTGGTVHMACGEVGYLSCESGATVYFENPNTVAYRMSAETEQRVDAINS